jgi:thymidylate kinase
MEAVKPFLCRVESEKEVRRRKAAELQSLINEKKALLERLQQQYESLKKVDQEQKTIIERLNNNEA